MSERKITVTIDQLGRPAIEAHGFAGGACTDATRTIELALAGGTGPTTRTLKPEWYQHDDTAQQEQEFQQW